MGAWIETLNSYKSLGVSIESHPTWVRGLKPLGLLLVITLLLSHPTWVRGLKHIYLFKG